VVAADRVGLLLPKSERAVVAMLGTLKSGATYVPVDPGLPASRARLILNDSIAKVLITTSRMLARLDPRTLSALEAVILVDGATTDTSARPRVLSWADALAAAPITSPSNVLETDPAYVLYTSGSTGTPKGVVLNHRHALNFVSWAVDTFGITGDDRVANHAPFHFDLSILDVFAALRAGACVVLVPNDVATFPGRLGRWIARERISIWSSVPSALTRLLLRGGLAAAPELRIVLFAGEVFPVKHLRGVMEAWPQARFFNLYGPTETNVCTYYALPERLPPEVNDLPIGTACMNTEVFAVGDDGNVVTEEGVGELYVRGPAIMSGYWRQPDRTAAALVANPQRPAILERVYRTGDIVRRDADGVYWFIGRRDHMVKVRGYRVELGEIEHALLGHGEVRAAVVVALPDDIVGARLHAVIVPNGSRPTVKSLQAQCGGQLPRYMMPERFHLWDALPLTSTGKVDRPGITRLLQAERAGSNGSGGYVADAAVSLAQRSIAERAHSTSPNRG
jgi:amino acid adenylation domain-containing protein